METVVIDGGAMSSREALHDFLAARLGLPDWYGRNLDALYDLLAARGGDVRLRVRRGPVEAALDGYGAALLRTLEDAARENPALRLEFEED